MPQTDARPTTPGAGIRYLLLILAAAAMILVDPVASRFLPPPPLPDPSSFATPDIDLVTKFAIALEQFQPPSTPGAPATDTTASLLPSLDNARTDLDEVTDRAVLLDEIVAQLRIAITAGEAQGSDGALERLAKLDGVTPPLDPAVEAEAAILEDINALRQIYTAGVDALDADARDRLLDRHGFMSRVALTYGQPDSNPDRAAIVRSSSRTLIGVGILGALAVSGFLCGCVLLITGIVLRATGRLAMRFRPDRTSDARTHNVFLEAGIVFLFLFAAFKALIIAASVLLPNAGAGLTIAQIGGQWLIGLAVFWPVVRGVDGQTVMRSMGWVRGRGIIREVIAGIATYLAFLPIVAIGFALMLVIMRVFGAQPSHPMVEFAESGSIWHYVVILSLASVWAPVVEESIFRGAMYHHARRFVGALAAALFTGLVFAGIHPQGIGGIPPLMALALGFAYCREWRGSLIGAMAAHAMHNAVLVTLAFTILG